MLRWPDAATVRQAIARWAEEVVRQRPEVRRLGYFGSYARGDWGVGSDLDLVVVVERSDQPFARRAAAWDVTELPVPVDLLVYTLDEWQSLCAEGRFGQVLSQETVWLYPQEPAASRQEAVDRR